jgi:Domain of unknown function (DUF6378)
LGGGGMVSDVENILEDRQEDYGDALPNFRKIGRIWGALLGIEDIPPFKVALMMDGLKSVRLSGNPEHKDSWVDKLGYTSLGQAITEETIKRCKCGAWQDLNLGCPTCTLIDERYVPKGESAK